MVGRKLGPSYGELIGLACSSRNTKEIEFVIEHSDCNLEERDTQLEISVVGLVYKGVFKNKILAPVAFCDSGSFLSTIEVRIIEKERLYLWTNKETYDIKGRDRLNLVLLKENCSIIGMKVKLN